MSEPTRCLGCGFEYDPVTEVTCPACTSGHVVPSAPVGVPKMDPRAAGRARAAVEYAEKQMLRERMKQSRASAARRNDRRIGAFQVAFGIPLAIVGLVAGGTLGAVPIYGPALKFAPVLVGVGFAIVGVLRMLKAPAD